MFDSFKAQRAHWEKLRENGRTRYLFRNTTTIGNLLFLGWMLSLHLFPSMHLIQRGAQIAVVFLTLTVSYSIGYLVSTMMWHKHMRELNATS